MVPALEVPKGRNEAMFMSKKIYVPDLPINNRPYTDHWVQFLNGFAIFHNPQGTQGVWKIAKKPDHVVKFCSVSGRIIA